jgi:signal transduction histidine kinase
VKYQRPEEHEKWVRVSLSMTGDSVELAVEDNGEGIPEDRLDTVFEMFQRNSNLSSGSGLGLYMVKEMVTRLGGAVSVTSVVGQGSRFVVTLPNLQTPTE